jgi:hypothetical protein
MTRSSPRQIGGPVSLLEVSGFGYGGQLPAIRRRYASIDDLARGMVHHRSLAVSPQGRIVCVGASEPSEGFWASGLYTSFEVFDRDDVLVEPHMVLHDIECVRREDREAYKIRCWKRRGWPKPPESYFRNGPLPAQRPYRRLSKNYKRVGTFAEVRAAAALDIDGRTDGMCIHVRGKRSPSLIGDNDWEGVWSMRSHDRSWKRHRATQWRP